VEGELVARRGIIEQVGAAPRVIADDGVQTVLPATPNAADGRQGLSELVVCLARSATPGRSAHASPARVGLGHLTRPQRLEDGMSAHGKELIGQG
jgi:hypothetical protein